MSERSERIINSPRALAFDLTGPLPTGRTLIEASAGTGKTYSVAALIARFVAGDIAGPGHDLAEGVGVDEILVVTFTRAAASELRDRIRGTLRDAADYVDSLSAGGPSRGAHPWMRVFDTGSHRVRHRRSVRLREALARFDEATITTIHGFCQQALAQSGLRAGGDQGLELVEDTSDLIAEVARDTLVERLIDDPLAMSTDGNDCPPDTDRNDIRLPGKVEGYVVNTVKSVLANPAARLEPVPAVGGIAGTWATVVGDVVRQVGERQLLRRQIGYDRLVTDLRDLLTDPATGPQLAKQLAGRYRLVLVDEFQDTDRLQWDVFNLAFAGDGMSNRLVTVGDPKQAIYRFRGADVHAYLDAVERSERSTLGTNHRSDQQLLDALAVLFHGATLGHDAIEFNRVAAAPGAPHNAMGSEPALHIRVVPADESIPVTTRGLEAGAVQRIVLTDTASRIRTLLDEGTITIPGTIPGTGVDGVARQVEPRDIAVLVPSQRRAAETAAVLRDWGIPSVRARTGSVLDSDAAVQWRLLLAGLVSPMRARVARAAGLGWFFDHDPAELADQHEPEPDPDRFETPMATLQRTLAIDAERLRAKGVGAFYEQVRSESALLRVVLSRPNGDRNLADLDHIADLLVSATRGGSTDPARVQQALDSMIAAREQSEATMRRIETDADAVNITTIHSAKGLEYPIVLVPFAYVERAMLGRPFVFNDGGQRVIDVASWVAWSDDGTEGDSAGKRAIEHRKHLAREEIDGDGLRLIYVALTRAKHRVEVWWAPTSSAATSAFGRLLLDRVGAGPVQNSPIKSPYEKLGDDVRATNAQIDAIVTTSNGTIGAFNVPLDQPIRRPLPVAMPAASVLGVADGSSRQPLGDSSWRSWSFTAITRSVAGGRSSMPTTDVAADPVGGVDEPTSAADASVPDPTPPPPPSSPSSGGVLAAADRVSMPLADTVGGTTFGVMVHEILEQVDFTSTELASDVSALAESGARRAGLALDTAALARGLVAAIDTPLGPLFDGQPLRAIAPSDRLAELTFDLAIAGDAAVSKSAARIGTVLADTLDHGDPLRSYGEHLATELEPLSIAGWLNGSIDAVFRVADPRADASRFVVVDYKSNRLHEPGTADPLAAYRPDRLVAAMTHSHYPLQAVLYSVALHRYLRWRLGAAYDPNHHLGGIAYLFVRGMVGPDTPLHHGTPHGVFSWNPPAATVLAIDALFRSAQVTP